jgi:hypothetical protein
MSQSGWSATRKLTVMVIATAIAFACGDRSTRAATSLLGNILRNADRDSEPWSPPRYVTTPVAPQTTTSNATGLATQNETEPSGARNTVGASSAPPLIPPPSAAEIENCTTASTRRRANDSSAVPETARTCTCTKRDLNAQLGPSVQHAFELARRGALFAARVQFVQVLRGVADAKDIESGGNEHSVALAAGLRALDESEDFVPHGAAVEAELDMRIAASSHRTPVLGGQPENTAPREAVALYHRYAQEQLGRAVAGEQVGSMALYGLGRIATRWSESNKADAISTQTQLTMFGAAVAACPANHLAANELGVCFCQTGHADEAAKLFEHTIQSAPTSTAYHNLAVAQQKLGNTSQAAANEQESQRLAASERATGAAAREVGVQWLSPAEMSGVAQSTEFPITPIAGDGMTKPTPKAVAVGEAPLPSTWQKVVRLAKSLPFAGSQKETNPMPVAEQTSVARLPDTQGQKFVR